jgi:hypothetical protein
MCSQPLSIVSEMVYSIWRFTQELREHELEDNPTVGRLLLYLPRGFSVVSVFTLYRPLFKEDQHP